MTTASFTQETTEALKLTERINRIEPSATMAVVAEADKLRQEGIDVVDFGAGEPSHIRDAAAASKTPRLPRFSRQTSRNIPPSRGRSNCAMRS